MLRKLFAKFIAKNLKSKIEVITKPDKQNQPCTKPQSQIDFDNRLLIQIKKVLSEYAFVKQDKISLLAEELLRNDTPNFGEHLLSVSEKKALNLNTRAKYTKEFIDCFHNVETLDFDPKVFCRNLKYTERTILWSFDAIERFKTEKIVTKVHLEGTGKWNNKIYSIDKIPKIEKLDYTQEKAHFFVTGAFDI